MGDQPAYNARASSLQRKRGTVVPCFTGPTMAKTLRQNVYGDGNTFGDRYIGHKNYYGQWSAGVPTAKPGAPFHSRLENVR